MPGLRDDDLLQLAPQGLRCAAGGFHVDPWAPVERAIVTHAHADHATAGCGRYLASPATAELLRIRLGPAIDVEPLAFGATRRLGGVDVSLHPAGHILGSAQVRITPTGGGPVWCVSGDYKTDPDPTCEAFEPVRCDVFLTESTFGLPIFRWREPERVAAELCAWVAGNRAAGATTLLLTYALGKAQRVLAALDPDAGPIGLHGAAVRLTEAYRALGVELPETVHANAETAPSLRGAGVVIAPPSVIGTTWPRRFAGREGGLRTAFVSGWTAIRGKRRWRSTDRGFSLSDHADWAGLLSAIDATGATRIGVTHGSAEELARYLAERGRESFVLPTRFRGELASDEDD